LILIVKKCFKTGLNKRIDMIIDQYGIKEIRIRWNVIGIDFSNNVWNHKG